MPHRVVTISKPSWLKKDLDQLSVEQAGEEVGRVPIEDIAVLVLESHGIAMTNELLNALVAVNAAVLVCDEKHLPHAALVPFAGNALHAKVVREQAACSAPKKKQIWKQIVEAKIVAQAGALENCLPGNKNAKKTAERLRRLAMTVRSGDPDNREAQAAAEYFPALFCVEFVRERELPGANAALNYGYAIVRAMVARALVGAGLHPALGVFHRGPFNPFNLADDAVEPLRPLVDEKVFQMSTSELEEPTLGKQARSSLLELTVCTVTIAGKPSPIEPALERYAASWREALCGGGRKLVVPTR